MQELKIRPCPIIFASFSGGPKACMYKVIQVNIIVCAIVRVHKSCFCPATYIVETQDNVFLADIIKY